MNTNELTDYIKNYLENDKTRRAIMLTGEWGCGKSYYIQNILTNELNKNKQDVAVVSLYGVKTVAELNKSIYLELRTKKVLKTSFAKLKRKRCFKNSKFYKWFNKHGKEVTNATVLVGKTIIKGVASFFNVPVEFSNKDFERLFSSINLEGKLIVLEDLERSGIDIIEIMGYVNNLVEQDGVKVLLVANESEMIKYEDREKVDKDGNKKTIKLPTKETEEYFRIKEKTVSDTILFNADLNSSIESILKLFDSSYFSRALEEKGTTGVPVIVGEISTIMYEVKCWNFRALIYSCQKTMELFKRATKNLDIKYFQFVLCANTAFALKLSKNSNLVWVDDMKSPNELGSYHFPLYRCCYNYIKLQYFDDEEFRQNEIAYKNQKSFETNQKELKHSLDILYSFSQQTEQELSAAVKSINSFLSDEVSYIHLSQYGKLANYLIAIRKYIDDESVVDKCKLAMLAKVKEAVLTSDIIKDITYHDGLALWTPEQQSEYNSFKKELEKETQKKNTAMLTKISVVDDIDKLAQIIPRNVSKYIAEGNFARQLDIKGALTALPKCSAAVISEFRGAVMGIYSFANVNQFLSGDRPYLILLKDGIENIIEDVKREDKIKALQLEWFVGNLNDIISRLN